MSPETEIKRLLVIAPEPVWPANHGARVDIWNRYQGLSREGWSLALIYWRRNSDGPTGLAPTSVFAKELPIDLLLGIVPKLRRLAHMMRAPSLAALRHVEPREFESILHQVQLFRPTAVICEFVYCSDLARRLAVALGVPLIMRSHNIEHRYMATQFRLARSIKQRLQILAARQHLKRYETNALLAADAVFDISKSDADYWRSTGIKNIHWVPSFFTALQDETGATIRWQDRDFDIGYLGNLWAPNNVAAVIWFLDAILPLVRIARPDVSVLIAGSNPRPELVERLRTTPNVTFLQDPTSAQETRAGMRVLINPIREGSGLNTKSVEMLFCDSPIVVTPFAVEGMDAATAQAFELAPDAATFAAGILNALDTPYVPGAARIAARRQFGQGGAAAMSALLCNEIARHAAKNSLASADGTTKLQVPTSGIR